MVGHGGGTNSNAFQRGMQGSCVSIPADSAPHGKLVKRVVAGLGLHLHLADERAHLLTLEVGRRALAVPAQGVTWRLAAGT